MRNHASGSEWEFDLGVIDDLVALRTAEIAADLERQLIVPTGQQVRDEVRVISSTGGAKGSKLARYDLLPWDAIALLAEHYGRGTFKYDDRNWEKGYKWGLSFAALQRHLTAHWNGDVYDLDPYLYGVDESGQPLYSEDEIAAFPDEDKVLHATAVAWHALCLLTFFIRGIGEDDRPTTH